MPQPQRPGSGDFTGRQKQQAAKEQAVALKERSAEMSMATSAETEEELFGVFDAQSGERINEPDPSSVAVLDEEDDVEVARPPRFGGAPQEQVFTGKEPPELQVPPVQAKRAFSQAAYVARPAEVTIRVDQDIEKMTYGMTLNGEPNNFDFKEGLAYKVPIAVADHLNERGLIRQWIG
jgi:hypothetical protein